MSSTARSQSTDEDDLAAALTALLSRHGLSGDSDPARVARVRAKLELARDMEGIDTANIIEDGGGRPARRAAARVDFKCVSKSPGCECNCFTHVCMLTPSGPAHVGHTA